MNKLLALATAALLLTGAAAQADTPDPSPDMKRAQGAVETGMRATLIDPNSALFEYGEPRRMTCSRRVFPANHDDGRWHGWGFDMSVNARNRMGGYAGRREFIVFIVGDSVEVYDPRYRNNMHCRPE